ncbi:hypothetical protein VSS37_21190 [Candidatus Thiothrix sp. Deng01]|uniref:Zinc-finger domain-containing protein n=1 Tax=Candidatus Thiothrix phosphatis TaxID=3112415 RepID=A0ABU6D330_9GAMM|nr:hypothetical protein [Candidatus Thiothrix sp. Deng01]MEB4593506.1 hypothetical protein [Candidatus Thiothrix sp. Deng01]
MSLYPSGSPVEEAHLLLPWYITGKLSEPERKLVESMLEQNAELKEEYLRELKMVDMIRSNSSLLQLTAVDTTQQRLDKLMKRIEREEQTKKNTFPEQAIRQANRKKAAFAWRELWCSLLPQGSWLMSARAVFAVLLLAQAGLIGWFAHSYFDPQSNVYITASAVDTVDKKAKVPMVSGMILLISFNESARMREVRDFLKQWNAHIVDGPDASNLFRIEIKDVPSSDQRSESILQQIRQNQVLVGFVGREF